MLGCVVVMKQCGYRNGVIDGACLTWTLPVCMVRTTQAILGGKEEPYYIDQALLQRMLEMVATARPEAYKAKGGKAGSGDDEGDEIDPKAALKAGLQNTVADPTGVGGPATHL